jgi:hypothetical protein
LSKLPSAEATPSPSEVFAVEEGVTVCLVQTSRAVERVLEVTDLSAYFH